MGWAPMLPGRTSPVLRLLVRDSVTVSDGAMPARSRDLKMLALRSPTEPFLVPTDRRAAIRSLLAYNRLRQPRVRLGRAMLAAGLAVGLGRQLGERRVLTTTREAELLLDHLAAVLDEPRLVFAGSDRECQDFVTPVLQLLTPRGRCVGFAKIGWDTVTAGMIDNEAETLRRIATEGVRRVAVPELVWHGRWHDLAILVTAPMPADVRRRPADAPPPIEPMYDVATLDGPLVLTSVGDSPYWAAALQTACEAAVSGRPELLARTESIAAQCADVELEFGRWHGDWVPWNLATTRRGALHAWDWAYSAPGVPFGFDALHYVYLPHEVLDVPAPGVARTVSGQSARRRRDRASARASEETVTVLRRLGLDAEARHALALLHRLEVDLRDTRAWLARRAAAGVAP